MVAVLVNPIAQQTSIGTVTAGGAMNAGGAGAMGAGTADPGDFPGGGGRRDPRAAANALLAAKLAAGMKTAANVLTQQYRDNENDDNKKCKTFPYSERGKECKGGKAHHMVPDRAWRSPGTRGKWTDIAPLDAALNNARESIPVVGQLYKGGYYYANMDEAKGLSICLSEKDHKDVHDRYDKEEKNIGLGNKPQYTAKLPELEELAAEKISAVTGCNKEKLLQEMRNHHRGLGFDDNTLLRADPHGVSELSIQKMGDLITSKTGGNTGF